MPQENPDIDLELRQGEFLELDDLMAPMEEEEQLAENVIVTVASLCHKGYQTVITLWPLLLSLGAHSTSRR